MFSETVWVLALSLSFISALGPNSDAQENYFLTQQRHRRDNDIQTSSGQTSTEDYQESDLIDLADLEAILSRENNSYNVVRDNDIQTSSWQTSNADYQESDLIDLADLEAILSRENNSYKVVMSRGVPQLKINDSFADTNEGTRKLLIFISNARLYAGGEGFSSSSLHESEGLTTTQMEYLRPDGSQKRENRYQVSYWNYKYQHGSGTQDILQKYEVKVMCQPKPPGHKLSVNGHTITSDSAVWHLTIREACRFWKA